jgi:hypothetical protein
MTVNLRANKTAKPIVAGVFNIIFGAGYLMGVLGLFSFSLSLIPFEIGVPNIAGAAAAVISIPLTIAGVISIVGGVFCLLRRSWGWALAGSITSIFLSHLFGIIAIILVAVSKDEFE